MLIRPRRFNHSESPRTCAHSDGHQQRRDERSVDARKAVDGVSPGVELAAQDAVHGCTAYKKAAKDEEQHDRLKSDARNGKERQLN